MKNDSSARTSENVIAEISRLRNNIKTKHRALTRNIMESEEILEKQLFPITEPLKKLVSDQKEPSETGEEKNKKAEKRKFVLNSADEEKEILDDYISHEKRFALAPNQGVKRKKVLNTSLDQYADEYEDFEYDEGMETEIPVTPLPETSETIFESVQTGEELLKTPEGRKSITKYINESFSGSIARSYFTRLINGGKKIDKTFGIHIDGNNWMLGDKLINLADNDLIINDKRYTGTLGLYELIIMADPDPYVYTEEDLKTYSEILKDTNVYRQNNSAIGRIKSSRSKKYKTIIAKLIGITGKGGGAKKISNKSTSGTHMIFTDKKPVYVYWNNPNELCERLKLLFASEQAGNTGHTNEINSILEELVEAGLIIKI